LFYNVIKAKKSNKKIVLTDDQIIFGKTYLTQNNEHFIKYVDYELSKLQEIFEKGNKSEQIKQLIKKFTQMAKINKGE
jgi:tRNA A22 N-methylase